MSRTKSKVSDLLTPSQEAVYGYVVQSSRWLTIYEISMLTGSSEGIARATMRELLKIGRVEVRKRTWGFDNGEREFKATITQPNDSQRKRRLSDYRLAGVEPLEHKLQRILGSVKARELLK